MIPSHGLVSPIRTPHERRTNNNDEQFCVGRRGPPEDARIFSFSKAARNEQPSSCCGDPSGLSPTGMAGSSNKIRSPPPVLCKIPTLQNSSPAWIKGEVPCLAASQKRGAIDPPSSEELASAADKGCNKAPLPAWKKKLLEKMNAKPDLPSWKQKLTGKKQTKDTMSEMVTETSDDPPWKQELATRKRERLARSKVLVQREKNDVQDNEKSEDLLQSGSDSFLIRTEAKERFAEDSTLQNQQESCTSIGLDPPDNAETIDLAQNFDEEAEVANVTDDHTDNNDDEGDDSSTCSDDRISKGKVSSFSGHDSGLEAFLQDAGSMITCSVTAVTASSSSFSASETSSPEQSHEVAKFALKTESTDDEIRKNHGFDIKSIKDGITEEQNKPPKMENNNVSEDLDSDDGFDDPSSDSDDDSTSENDEWGTSKISTGFSLSTSARMKNSTQTDSTNTPQSPKRRKARRYALPLCDEYSSDGEEDVLPPGVTPAVVPPMEFDFSAEDFSATTDEETLFLADHYNRQRSVVKKATFSDEPTKDDIISTPKGRIDGNKKKHSKKKKKKTKSSACSVKTEKSTKSKRKSSKSKEEDSVQNKSSSKKKKKTKSSHKEKETMPGETHDETRSSARKVKLDRHDKHKTKKTKSSTTGSVSRTETSENGKDSVTRSKSLKKDRTKKSSSNKKNSKHGDEFKKKDSKHTKKKGEKKTKKSISDKEKKKKKEKSKHVRSSTMSSF